MGTSVACLLGCDPVDDCAELSVRGDSGQALLTTCIDYARTAQERRVGLTGRSTLAADEGLLLVFPVTGETCISQAFVSFAIDIVYIGERLDVLHVEPNVAAGTEGAICINDVRYVLEVAGGQAANIGPGATVVLP